MSEEYCEKCERRHEEGLRDDEGCPYYGEPNGCNHPRYGYDKEDGSTEKWQDIVAEMRTWDFAGFKRPTWPDRIEAACMALEENERIVIQSAQARHNEEVNALKCEIAKLRRALVPVIKVDVERFSTAGGCLHACDAIHEAQAIMKGGEV